jgi:poly(3-hydroxybutyrate) depolymerase
MRRPSPFFSAVGVSLALAAGCGPPRPRAGVDAELHVSAGVEAVRLSAEPLMREAGFGEASWRVGGTTRAASLWVPEGRPRSLIVMLHGAVVRFAGAPTTEPATAARLLLRCLAQPAFQALEPLIIAPHGADGQWWTKDDTAFVLGLLAAARQRWPELASRSAITGYSNGGIAAWYFARLYPEWLSAAVPIASNDMIIGPTPVPIYAIQGDKDELFPIAPTRAAIHRERERGADITLAVRHRAGHMTPCAYRPELEAAGHWLEQHAFARRRRR